jgi:hypothetical protein
MIDQIILSLLDALRRREIHSIRFTHVLDLFPCPCKPYNIGVEFGEVFFEDGRRVARWVAGYEEGEERGVWVGEAHEVDHAGHFVEFFGADVGTVGEAEINLSTTSVSLYFKIKERGSKQTKEYFPFISSLENAFPF